MRSNLRGETKKGSTLDSRPVGGRLDVSAINHYSFLNLLMFSALASLALLTARPVQTYAFGDK